MLQRQLVDGYGGEPSHELHAKALQIQSDIMALQQLSHHSQFPAAGYLPWYPSETFTTNDSME
eukprot:6569509-Heterocapsa_arctica.AAC.1